MGNGGHGVADGSGHSASRGERFSHYRIIERIGAGGMGEVYRAEDTRLGREVALKFLPKELTNDPDARARFEREARAASALDQVNICTIHDIDETEDGRLFIAMALYEGETLDARIARGPLPVAKAVDVAYQVARGLDKAHDSGIIHRDLKPSNVMLTADGDVKILDFGIAKLVGAEDLTRTGTSVGTLDYMAPEQVDGRGVDARTDVWALGVVLYEMLTGTRPFAGRTPHERIVAVLAAEPAAPSGLRGGVPAALDALVLDMLAKDPSDRPSSMRDVWSRLAAHRTAIPIPGPALPQRKRAFAVGATLAVVALAAIAVLALRFDRAESPIDSIAVLPFENVSTTPDGEYLSDGLTASLTDRLSQIDELRVVPRGVAAAFGGPDVDLAEAGRSLGVRALVTGRVGEVRGRLVVRAELIDVDELSQIWGAQFDRPLTDILEVQDSLVREIADQLQLELTSEEDRALTSRSTDNPEAYRLYLLSRFHNLSLSPEGLRLGRQYAEEAVRLDPGYALGWAALSDSYQAQVVLGLEPREEGHARAREAAETAVALDESLSIVHMVLGFVRHHIDWDWEGALAEFRRAIQLDPASADAHQGMSEGFLSLGRVDEAVDYAERAVARDPITPVISMWLGLAYLRAGRGEEALQALQRSLELESNNMLALLIIPSALSQMGRHDEAVEAAREFLTRFGFDPAASPMLALALARQGRQQEAREILARVDLESESLATVARAWAWLGELERAFPLLEEGLERREQAFWWIKTDSSFDPLRGDPRFEAILERMGLDADP